MKPEEALDFLDRAVAQINGPRQVHVQFQQAIQCLRIVVANRVDRNNTAKPEETSGLEPGITQE